jgi:hypothetical protein
LPTVYYQLKRQGAGIEFTECHTEWTHSHLKVVAIDLRDACDESGVSFPLRLGMKAGEPGI